jgi:alpha,alpha-trehalase
MVQLEATLSRAYDAARQLEQAAALKASAERRKAAVQHYLWDADRGYFTDYLWREGQPSGTVTAATLFPLFFSIATESQAKRVEEVVRARVLQPGGFATTAETTGQQWDAPNGWAPLQWIAIEGLNDYGESKLAATIAERCMTKVITAYDKTGKLMGKYDVATATFVTGGGEYPSQDGFGWTNGVLRKLLVLYPNAVAPRRVPARAPAPLLTTTCPSRGRDPARGLCQRNGTSRQSSLHPGHSSRGRYCLPMCHGFGEIR